MSPLSVVGSRNVARAYCSRLGSCPTGTRCGLRVVLARCGSRASKSPLRSCCNNFSRSRLLFGAPPLAIAGSVVGERLPRPGQDQFIRRSAWRSTKVPPRPAERAWKRQLSRGSFRSATGKPRNCAVSGTNTARRSRLLCDSSWGPSCTCRTRPHCYCKPRPGCRRRVTAAPTVCGCGRPSSRTQLVSILSRPRADRRRPRSGRRACPVRANLPPPRCPAGRRH